MALHYMSSTAHLMIGNAKGSCNEFNDRLSVRKNTLEEFLLKARKGDAQVKFLHERTNHAVALLEDELEKLNHYNTTYFVICISRLDISIMQMGMLERDGEVLRSNDWKEGYWLVVNRPPKDTE